MTDRKKDNEIVGFAETIDPMISRKYRNEISAAAQKEVQSLILSVDEFWQKLKMLAVVDEKMLVTKLLKKQFFTGNISIASDNHGVGIPAQLELLVDFVKAFGINELDIPGATNAREGEIIDSIFYLIHPRHYMAAVCCFEGLSVMTKGIEDKLAARRHQKIGDKAASILQKFNHAKEINLGFTYARDKHYTNFMCELIKHTGKLAFSKFKTDYEEKEGLEGWEVAGWELINAIEIDVQQFPELGDLVKQELVSRLNQAGVETRDISQYISKCNFSTDAKMEKKYSLIEKLETAQSKGENKKRTSKGPK